MDGKKVFVIYLNLTRTLTVLIPREKAITLNDTVEMVDADYEEGRYDYSFKNELSVSRGRV